MTTPTLAQVIAVLEQHHPSGDAAEWDRVGLVTGDPEQSIFRIAYAVDPTLAVIDEARAAGTDLLVTHHPLLLRGVNSVATTSAKGAAITSLVVADIALYCAHTNADLARPGVNDALAAAAGLPEDADALCEDGLGRVGDLPEPLSLKDFASRMASALPAAPAGIRVSGDPAAQVQRIAVLGGAGDDRFEEVRAAGADVYVTADLRHHPALEAREEARGGTPYLIDAGHWATESLWLQGAADRLREALAEQGYSVEIRISTLRTDPWDFLVQGQQ
ncbi:Nif3-like dinuclear metal center hexameric protein [Calidifontibacter sp. DB0510]|uniref:GTP cyclohydrolase 1 type 2 homolog n=1 Tax=Metallococcus carri TaxID=1656884 RepID=A0A967B4G0_9MICO|nr:Nif3-like dinuclear metal center hexameric protein [Metallococcus carri]NHN57358.1 Nif3-like dinuclear metal center hexameric protein [Metallococcus carri]NOP39136.1 Nif3-like dinuclear metal center hexameric protein [Calidifontibacter sp. DB2511S]